jgi:AcrR family transcriptional regulator
MSRQPKRTFLVLDIHGEYRDLLPLYAPEELIWMTADELGLNPFEVPAGEDGKPVMPPDKWINNLREWLRMFWLNEPSCNLFCEILREEYQRRGVLDGSGDWPSLSDVIEAIQQLSPPRGSDRAKAKDKLLDRLESLRALLPGLDVQKSRDFRQLMSRSVILDLVDVKDVALPVLFALLVTLFREVFRSEGERGISRLLVMEEAHEYMGGQLDKRISDLKESMPSGVLRDLRKTGASGIVVSQLIQDVASSVRGNLGSVVCMRQGHRQGVREAGAALNLAAWQEQEVARLPNRHAIARFSRYGEPVYLAVKDARSLGLGVSPPPSREEARERSRPVLEAIPFVKRCERPTASVGAGGVGVGAIGPSADGEGSAGSAAVDGGLHSREMRVFACIAERPWELIEDRMDALGLDRESEGDARAKLEARGLTGFAGVVGAKNRLFELTARGRAFAEERGLTVARGGGAAGSVVHQAVIEYVQRSLGGHSPSFRFQRAGASSTTAGVQPDLLLVMPGGGRIPIQACCRNQPGDEASALMKLHRLAQLGVGDADKVDFVIAVAANKRHKAALERALQEKNGGRMPDRIVLLDFDSVTDAAFDWASVFEMSI